MPKILIADDDEQLSGVIHGWLSLDHHSVECVNNGLDALERLKISDYDLAILDLDMPGKTGLEVLSSIRSDHITTPVLILTGKDSIEYVERGFEAGADDYLRKPFHGKELAARVKALLRRPPDLIAKVLSFKSIELDRESYKVTKDGVDVNLLPREFALLEFLMRYPNRVFTAEALLNRVWEADSDATVEAVTSCIKRLRQKIDSDAERSLIRTIRGAGYKLEG